MGLHWADIYAAIYKNDSTPTQIAHEEQVPLSTVTGVIRSTKTSHRIAYAIAAITGMSTEKMWPGKYLDNPAEYKRLRGSSERGRLPSTQDTELMEAS